MNMDEKTKHVLRKGKKKKQTSYSQTIHKLEGVQIRLSLKKYPAFDILSAPKSVSLKGMTSTIGLETPSQIKLNFCSKFHHISWTTPDLRTFGKDKLLIQKLKQA